MSCHLIYPISFYWHFRAPNAEEFIEAVENCHEPIDNDQFRWGKECVIDRVPLKWESWMSIVTPSLHEVANQMNRIFGFVMYDPWINYYKRGYFQEVHDHAMQDLAMVFFANDGEGFSKFCFTDRYSTSLRTEVKKLVGYQNIRGINYKAGDVIIFPGHLMHMVTPHQSDVTRKTFACNIQLKDVCKPEVPPN
jgi:hypothetical protein|tara:strand:+ start:2313 stop:2891 length:579 start_codon:yes stop_codon:yes gene_type:complete